MIQFVAVVLLAGWAGLLVWGAWLSALDVSDHDLFADDLDDDVERAA